MIPFLQGNSFANAQIFYAPLTTSLVPAMSFGSGTPTFTRATTATVMAYSPTAVPGDPLLVTAVASGEARFYGARRISSGVWSDTYADGTPIASSTLKGYLAEGSRTNRCLQSETLGTTWVATNITVANNQVAAPDGATTAETLTATAGNGTLIQDLGVVASAAKTGSIWLKRKTGTGNIQLTMDNGATWTTVAVDSTWTRFSLTQTLADEDFGIRIVTNGDEVYAWGGQVETASFASSYIPTTTVSVTRNADVLSYAAANNISATAGSCYAETNLSVTGGAAYQHVVWQTDYIMAIDTPSRVAIFDGTNLVRSTSFSLNTDTKMATAWSGSAADAARNGAVTSGSFDGSIGSGANFYVGNNDVGATPVWSGIRNVRIFNRKFSSSELQGLTT